MNPTDYGLPPKFATFRPGQYDAIIDMAASDRRFFLASIPTGGGKSPAYITLHRMLEARTLVLTANRGLQQQLVTDFGAIGMEDIRGQNNYRCKALDRGGELQYLGRPGTTCDEGPCHVGASCSLMRRGCLYYDQVKRAAKAPLVVSNYAYWLTMGRWSYEEKIGEFDLLICDEAHRVPDILAEFCAIRIDRDEVRLLLGLSTPSAEDDPDVWIEWAEYALSECERIMGGEKSVFKDPTVKPEVKRTTSNRLKRFGSLQRALSDLTKASLWRRSEPGSPPVWMPGMQTDWIVERTDTGVRFIPVWAHAYAEDYLFRRIPKVVLTSATLQPIITRYLGINPKDSEFKNYDSTFDPTKRPVIWIPTVGISTKTTSGEYRQWVNRMDRIIDARLDRKGIIMPRSYDRMDQIAELSTHTDLMITHTRRGTRDAVTLYKMSNAPRILVSPAIEEGFDFPDDECRYIIIAKVPFFDHRDSVMHARMKSDKNYSNYLTSQSIIQQAGRGWRSERDWCEVFIIDDNIRWFWASARKANMWPGYFVKSYRIMRTIPDPPTLLGTGGPSRRIKFRQRG